MYAVSATAGTKASEVGLEGNEIKLAESNSCKMLFGLVAQLVRAQCNQITSIYVMLEQIV